MAILKNLLTILKSNLNFPPIVGWGGGEDKLIKVKRGTYEALTTSNIPIPYGQPVVGDADSGTLKSGQCGSVLTIGDEDNLTFNSINYRYYALPSNFQQPGIVIHDPNYYNNGIPYGVMVTDTVETGVITVNNGSPNVSSVLPIICGGTGAGTVEGARSSLGLGNLATLDTINLNSSTTTGTLPLSKGDTGATTASAAKSNIGLSNVVNERQYSEQNPPPYPVTSVNSKTGAVILSNTDVGAVKNGGVTGQDGSHQMAMS